MPTRRVTGLWRHLSSSSSSMSTSTSTSTTSPPPAPARGSTSWLHARLSDKSDPVRVLDGTWFLRAAHGDRSALGEFSSRRIPTSSFFDLDGLSDADTPLPHMLPRGELFAARVERELGLGSDDEVVVYDALGQFSAARCWWTLVVMGGNRVRLLDGGLPKWIREGRPVETGPPVAYAPRPRGAWRFEPQRLAKVVSLREMEDIVADVVKTKTKSESGVVPVPVVDARPAGRFRGVDPEPRPGLRKGKIPGSLNFPFKDALNEDGTFKSRDELAAVLAKVGLDARNLPPRVVCTCGSGTTAAVVAFALEQMFGVEAPIYDGSFAEWAQVDHPERPVVDESVGAGAASASASDVKKP